MARSPRSSTTSPSLEIGSRSAARSADTSSGMRRWAGRSFSRRRVGVVPLTAMLRQRARAGANIPTQLLFSSRHLEEIIYRGELERLAAAGDGLEVVHTLTRWILTAGQAMRVGSTIECCPRSSSCSGSQRASTSVAPRRWSRPPQTQWFALACRRITSGPSASARPGHQRHGGATDGPRRDHRSECRSGPGR